MSPEMEALVYAAVREMREEAHDVIFAGTKFYPDGMEPCGKHWHRTREEADAEVKKLKPSRGPRFVLNSYYCHGCDGYHVGHTLKRTK